MEQNKDKPVLPALVDGLGKAAYRLVEPFVSESIWIQGIQDVFSRGGETQEGTRVYYERDEPGTKLSKTIQYLAKTLFFRIKCTVQKNVGFFNRHHYQRRKI